MKEWYFRMIQINIWLHSFRVIAVVAKMLPLPPKGLLWLHHLLHSFSCYSPLGLPRLSALGTASGLPQTLLLPPRDTIPIREGDAQGL